MTAVDWKKVVEERPELLRITQPVLNQYIPCAPTPKQTVFLNLQCREALFGGAAGGGKSSCLLMAALQYVHIPRYRAILFRQSFADLVLPGALIDMSYQWLWNSGAKWKAKEHYWEFPNGSTVGFGYLDSANDIYRYQSSEFSYIGFDELTQFRESQYRYMFSRLRRPRCPKHQKQAVEKCRICREYGPIQSVPLRIRAATNPGGMGHDWVKDRFIDAGNSPDRIFVPSSLNDNPFLDRDEYVKALANLDPVTRRQLMDGDWLARSSGGFFRRDFFLVRDAPPAPNELLATVRYWDLAASAPRPGTDHDWTVGAKIGIDSSMMVHILNVRRFRGTPREVEAEVRASAEADGIGVTIVIERERGGAGKALLDHYRTRILPGFAFYDDLPTGEKSVRAGPISSYAQNGYVTVVRGHWNADFFDELEAFPYGAHDDQVDAVAGAFNWLMNNQRQDLNFLQGTLLIPAGELELI